MSITFEEFQEMIKQSEAGGACNQTIRELKTFKSVEEFESHKWAPYWTYWYARNTIKGRFSGGEHIISKDSYYSYWYAENVIKGRFPEGEYIIADSASHSYWYAKDVLKERFINGEKTIKNNKFFWNEYKEHFKIEEDQPILLSELLKRSP